MPRQSHRSPVNEIQECTQGGVNNLNNLSATGGN